MTYLLRLSLVAAALSSVAGCGGPGGEPSEQGAAGEEASAPAAEPAEPQPVEEEPAGEVVEVGGGPEGIVAEPETGLVAVGLREPDELAIVDCGRGEVVRTVEGEERLKETIDAPRQPGGVAVTGSGLVGVIGVSALDLEVFDGETLESLGRVEAGEGPTHLGAGPGDRFYVTDTRGDAMLTYEAAPEPGQVGRVPLPGRPYGVAVDPGRGHLRVTLTAENELVQFDLGGDALRELARYPTVSEPNTVAVDTSSGRVFVAGRADGELQIPDPR